MANDPHRVLGLAPAASAAEIKRAYRALAKANHPDSAGESALPRFLAIQAAYEQLTGIRGSPGGSRPGAGPAKPWKADPARAREARDRARPGEARGNDPRAEEPGGRARQRGPDRPSGNSGSRGPAGGPGSSPGGPRRRATKKATFGSTTYGEARDPADPIEPADPAWEGASWYGPSSGEYWRINPREYADPRKHGPEYQARAAERAARSGARADARAAGHDKATPDSAGPRGDEPRAAEPRTAEPRTAEPRTGHDHGQAARTHRARTEAAPGADPERPARGRAARSAQWVADVRAADARAADARAASSRAAAAAAATSAPPRYDDTNGHDTVAAPAAPWAFPSGLARLDAGPFRRIGLALIAWPPLGIGAAAVIGEATGCAAFSATCTSTAQLYPWAAQAGIIAVLAIAPAIARLLAGGTAAVIVLAFPAAAALSASGANYDRTYGPASLIAVLALGWIVGVAAMTVRALRMRSRG